ncbi:GMC family oxidoreductase [Mesorhizobium sp.]|uniref:GMC oxidoreductase n=1 Tax=Mesorhizobium sp. TaxID=1871066 RepID=UPI000FE5E755|nr:GMC family oxidoreductase [Mesorhizobium sp.]RWC62398.1 MAG: GMC family oxidoreductase [Mesorhizobium sp.]RWC65705.1 MAG: GMC family oxidoreductase [Mesorhizobium sp.]
MDVDVCIVGTGAAGGILAYRLARLGLATMSVDAGDVVPDSYFRTDEPQEAEQADQFNPFNAQASRLFADTPVSPADGFAQHQILRVGGLQNLWGGVSLRFSDYDFSGLGHSTHAPPWPITYDDLEPYYADVEGLIGVTGAPEGNADLPDGVFIEPLPLNRLDRRIYKSLKAKPGLWSRVTANRKAVETRPSRHNRCRRCGMCQNGCYSNSIYKFSSRLLPEIVDAPNYRLKANTVVQSITCGADGKITGLRCFDRAKATHTTVTARRYVLCAGAIENAKILLSSHTAEHSTGLANSSGLVGRHLMDNPNVVFVALHPRFLFTRKETYFGYGNHLLVPAQTSGDDGVETRYLADIYHGNPHLVPLFKRNLPKLLSRRLAERITFGSSLMFLFGPAESHFDNRVEICDGQPRVFYNWTQRDRAVIGAIETQGRQMVRAVGGVFLGSYPGGPGDSIHYAGTCRMSSDPVAGVVDANLRSFDHRNLFICDGSVLPSLPEKHSALTMMALASRLSAYLGSPQGRA